LPEIRVFGIIKLALLFEQKLVDRTVMVLVRLLVNETWQVPSALGKREPVRLKLKPPPTVAEEMLVSEGLVALSR
jgi:hypothetical protein